MKIKNNLQELIEQSPYKRSYIEKELGVNRNTLTNWMNGRTYPSVLHLLKLAKILNVDISEIYKMEDDEYE